MGLLESVIGSLLQGSAGGTSSPMGAILSSLLTGGQGGQGGGMGGGNPGTGGLGGMLGGGMGGSGMGGGMGGGGLGGGLGGLISQFEQAGLGHVAQSWVGNGPNQPVSPSQLQDVFGQQQVQGMADQAGMEPGDFLSQLSQHLPHAVSGVTPNGQLPDEGSLAV